MLLNVQPKVLKIEKRSLIFFYLKIKKYRWYFLFDRCNGIASIYIGTGVSFNKNFLLWLVKLFYLNLLYILIPVLIISLLCSVDLNSIDLYFNFDKPLCYFSILPFTLLKNI
uniref:Uncharacterized protein n=1 Tax=Juglanconis oblonga TaxID=1940568 RepID=A0A291LI93_9PEZI|nr:hypothetical protein [Juglanconis oblonga]ATI20401.1 hypothetical protein [Juglanconis oblonga]